MKRLFILPLCILLTTIICQSQPGLKPDTAIINAMNKLSFLVGEWQGEGWIQMGRDKRTFVQKETVIQKVHGAALVIDGLGVDVETNQIAHEAFAIISYDLANRKYLVRAFRADGNYVDAEGAIDANGTFQWGFTHPQAGPMTYTIKNVDGRWVETGEMKMGGNTYKFIEMNLSKTD